MLRLDFKCDKCGQEKLDVLVEKDEVQVCSGCGSVMERQFPLVGTVHIFKPKFFTTIGKMIHSKSQLREICKRERLVADCLE